MKKKLIIISSIVIICGAGGIYGYAHVIAPRLNDRKITAELQNKPDLLANYQAIKKDSAGYNANNKNAQDVLLSDGERWKTLGEQTKDPAFFKKALDTYEEGIRNFGSKNVIFYWNAANIAVEMKDFTLAEKYYQDSIKTAPTYMEGYLYLAELYQQKLHASPDEILKVYDDGFKATSGNAEILLSKSDYLNSIGRYADSLAGYQLISKQFPANQGYKEIIKELEGKIAEGGK